MYEESLKVFSMDELCSLMIKTIEQYYLLEKLPGSNKELEQKRAEIFLLHKLINDKEDQSVH